MDGTAGVILYFVIMVLVVVMRKREVETRTFQDWVNFLFVSAVIAAVIWALLTSAWHLINPAL